MPKSPLLRKIKTDKKEKEENLRRQKFAIWDYYRKKNKELSVNKKKKL